MREVDLGKGKVYDWNCCGKVVLGMGQFLSCPTFRRVMGYQCFLFHGFIVNW
jgi:hypothetical protein